MEAESQETASSMSGRSIGSRCFSLNACAAFGNAEEGGNNNYTFQGQKMLVKEMTNMGVAERQQVYEEVHGVDQQKVLETPQLVQDSVDAMRKILHQKDISNLAVSSEYEAFRRARFLVPTRVFDGKLLLMFLRREEFHVGRAVQRYMRFFEYSFKLFGLDGILHDCCQDDLNLDDANVLSTGCIVPLWKSRDQSGRLVIFFHTPSARFKQERNYFKAAFYMFWKALQDPEVQRKGFVMVSWNLTNDDGYVPPLSAATIEETMVLFDSLPIRISSAHFCYDSSLFSIVLDFTLIVIGRAGRLRSRTWHGNWTECKYNLMTFGIPVSDFPLSNESGNLEKESFLEWVQDEGEKEKLERAGSDRPVEPTTKDVLLGRGLPYRSFPGNIALGKLVEDFWPVYQAIPITASIDQRYTLYRDILSTLQRSGGRILYRQDAEAQWFEASEKQAFQRIAKSLRNKKVVDKYRETRKKK